MSDRGAKKVLRGRLSIAQILIPPATFTFACWAGYRAGHTGEWGSELLNLGICAVLGLILGWWTFAGLVLGKTGNERRLGWIAGLSLVLLPCGYLFAETLRAIIAR
jgi:hypothetical protein